MQTNVKQCDLTFFLKCLHASPKTGGFNKYLYQIPFVDLHMPQKKYRCKCKNPYNFHVLLKQPNTMNKNNEQKIKYHIVCVVLDDPQK